MFCFPPPPITPSTPAADAADSRRRREAVRDCLGADLFPSGRWNDDANDDVNDGCFEDGGTSGLATSPSIPIPGAAVVTEEEEEEEPTTPDLHLRLSSPVFTSHYPQSLCQRKSPSFESEPYASIDCNSIHESPPPPSLSSPHSVTYSCPLSSRTCRQPRFFIGSSDLAGSSNPDSSNPESVYPGDSSGDSPDPCSAASRPLPISNRRSTSP